MVVSVLRSVVHLLNSNTFELALFFTSELHDAVFVVGSLDETIMLRGMRYHPIDVENAVLRSHKKIAEWLVFIDFIYRT